MNRETELFREWLFKSDDPNISELREEIFLAIKLIHGNEISNQIQIEEEQKDREMLAHAKMMQRQLKYMHEMFKEPARIETKTPPSKKIEPKPTWFEKLKNLLT